MKTRADFRIMAFAQLTARRMVFLTNNLTLPVLTIDQLYKKRWEVELFFKWIKQHLRISPFLVKVKTTLESKSGLRSLFTSWWLLSYANDPQSIVHDRNVFFF